MWQVLTGTPGCAAAAAAAQRLKAGPCGGLAWWGGSTLRWSPKHYFQSDTACKWTSAQMCRHCQRLAGACSAQEAWKIAVGMLHCAQQAVLKTGVLPPAPGRDMAQLVQQRRTQLLRGVHHLAAQLDARTVPAPMHVQPT